MEYSEVQKIAKDTMEYIKTEIAAGIRLTEIRRLCEEKMLALGADSFWYWDIGAFVFAGDETAVSVSGREYKTSDRVIASDDIITIDLSPQNNSIWGDYARTVIIEDGRVVGDIGDVRNEEWRRGLLMEEELHRELLAFAAPQTTFEELYRHINELIISRGFINLDFLGNLGHSIVRDKNERIYTEKGNNAQLSSVGYFTFEPHISVAGSVYGYKKENIYYFSEGRLTEL
ncbi:MAG: M24 family metallopeptidase [Ruminococcus sp.]|nr:M24 family metallopeptidase [Ruminococcus sp.]